MAGELEVSLLLVELNDQVEGRFIEAKVSVKPLPL